MKLYYSDHIDVPLPPDHRFPIRKYRLLREQLASVQHRPTFDLSIPQPASDEQLGRVHQATYIQRVQQGELTERELRRTGFPWSPALASRSRHSVGGTIQACRAALAEGIGINLAGGTHHAFPDHGEGFCVFNDCAVAVRTMQAEQRLGRAVIIDCDAHQGNGTAAIFAGDPTVYTFSIHGARTFPYRKRSSDLDVALPDRAGDETYLAALGDNLARVLASAQADLALYLAGADPYQGDRLGGLGLSKAGLAERDRLVLQHCRQAGLPVAITMAGGYARDIQDTVDIHHQTVQIAAELLAG